MTEMVGDSLQQYLWKSVHCCYYLRLLQLVKAFGWFIYSVVIQDRFCVMRILTVLFTLCHRSQQSGRKTERPFLLFQFAIQKLITIVTKVVYIHSPILWYRVEGSTESQLLTHHLSIVLTPRGGQRVGTNCPPYSIETHLDTACVGLCNGGCLNKPHRTRGEAGVLSCRQSNRLRPSAQAARRSVASAKFKLKYKSK